MRSVDKIHTNTLDLKKKSQKRIQPFFEVFKPNFSYSINRVCFEGTLCDPSIRSDLLSVVKTVRSIKQIQKRYINFSCNIIVVAMANFTQMMA